MNPHPPSSTTLSGLSKPLSAMEFWGVEKILSIGWGIMGFLALGWALRVVEWLWGRPRRLELALRAQGLRGSPYRFLYGDHKEETRVKREALSKPIPLSHNIIPRVEPSLHLAMNKYGKNSFSWYGLTPSVTISDPELIREVLSNKLGNYEKPKISSAGGSLATYEGEKWAKHRRIINPAFHLEKLKQMLSAFSTCCDELINRWETLACAGGTCEVDVWPELQNFTGDVISRTAFGSNYEEGRRIFQLQREAGELYIQSVHASQIPGYRFLPTSRNMRRKEIGKEVYTLLKGVIEKREKAIKKGDANNNDLLGLLLESNLKESEEHGKSKKNGMTMNEVIEECKLFYFAGQETTSVLLTWTMIVLSMHPTWQVRAREEVLQTLGKNKPDIDALNHLKIVTMILYEVLRLYPPLTLLRRKTYKTMELGGITLPPGVVLTLPIISIHHDPQFWGEDANEFKPERFAEGVSKASKNHMAFFPFGWGPRVCIGQSFAMIEAKMGLSMILQHFSFELSPSYTHAPYTVITLQPQHGAQIILHKL